MKQVKFAKGCIDQVHVHVVYNYLYFKHRHPTKEFVATYNYLRFYYLYYI